MPDELHTERPAPPWSVDRTYADHVSIRIRVVDSAADDAIATEEWEVSSSGAAWPPDWLVENAESIALDAGSRDREYPAEYYIEVNERRMNWGADASVIEILIGLASWAATSAAWDATKALASRMAKRIGGDSDPAIDDLPNESAATAAAIELTARRYKEDADDLTLDSVELQVGQAKVALRSPGGWIYEYEIHISGHDVHTSRIRRYRADR